MLHGRARDDSCYFVTVNCAELVPTWTPPTNTSSVTEYSPTGVDLAIGSGRLTLPVWPALNVSGTVNIKVLVLGVVRLTFNVSVCEVLLGLLYATLTVTWPPCFTVEGFMLMVNVGNGALTVNVVVALLLLCALSVAVMVIVCTPMPTSVPATGLCCNVTMLQSLVLVCASTFGTGALPWLFAVAELGAGA